MEKGHSKMSHLPNWLAQTFSRPQCAIKVCVHSSKLILRYDMEWWAALMRSPRPVPVPVPVPIPYASPHTHRLNWLSLDWMSMTDRWGTVRWMGEGVGTLGKCCSPDQIDFLASRRVVCLTFLRPFHSVRLLRLLTLYGFIAHLTEWEIGRGIGGKGCTSCEMPI